MRYAAGRYIRNLNDAVFGENRFDTQQDDAGAMTPDDTTSQDGSAGTVDDGEVTGGGRVGGQVDGEDTLSPPPPPPPSSPTNPDETDEPAASDAPEGETDLTLSVPPPPQPAAAPNIAPGYARTQGTLRPYRTANFADVARGPATIGEVIQALGRRRRNEAGDAADFSGNLGGLVRSRLKG